MTPRNFLCPETDEPCGREDCTRHNCVVVQAATRSVAQVALSPEEERIRKLAIPVAREIAAAVLLKRFNMDARQVRQNPGLLAMWSKNRGVVRLARKRVKDEG